MLIYRRVFTNDGWLLGASGTQKMNRSDTKTGLRLGSIIFENGFGVEPPEAKMGTLTQTHETHQPEMDRSVNT